MSLVQNLASRKLDKFSVSEREEITKWLHDNVELLNLSTLTRVDSREFLLASIERHPVRTYMLELCISFYCRGGSTYDFEEKLVNSIADGLRIDGRNPEYCELPQEVLVSAPLMNFPATLWHPLVLAVRRTLRLAEGETSLSEYLLSNRHMQMIVLLALADDLD